MEWLWEKVIKSLKRINIKLNNSNLNNDFIIDFEFNGLPRYGFKPEITQFKCFNVKTKQAFCFNYKTFEEGFIFQKKYKTTSGEKFFSKEEFFKALNIIGAKPYNNFYMFSNKTDLNILENNYNIFFLREVCIDLQEELSLVPGMELKMAYYGRSMETCYYLIKRTELETDHNSVNEIYYIKTLYLYNKLHKKDKNSVLTVFPHGDLAGKPLKLFCNENRRKADGYRYNNNDLLSKSLNYYIEKEESEYYEERS